MYTDVSGALRTISLDGHQYYFIAYDYDSNYIFVEPIKDVNDATVVEAFQKVFETLEDRGMKPTLNITDNQAVKPIKAFLVRKDCKWRFVEPSNHRVNVQRREPSKPSKITSSADYAQPTKIGHFNFGISSHIKQRSRSTYYVCPG